MKVTDLYLDFVKLWFVGTGLFTCCDRLLKCMRQTMLTLFRAPGGVIRGLTLSSWMSDRASCSNKNYQQFAENLPRNDRDFSGTPWKFRSSLDFHWNGLYFIFHRVSESFLRTLLQHPEDFFESIIVAMTTLAWGFLVTNYHDGGRKVSKSSLDRGRKQKRPLRQTAVDAWHGWSLKFSFCIFPFRQNNWEIISIHLPRKV